MARFNEMLLNRRRQLGMSVQQVANVIKIRPQIIEYFETGDFTQMPPRGYAQGMISSYARYLGLNPREVIDAYFDDLYAFEQSTRTQAGRFQSAVMETRPRAGTGYRLSSSPLAGSRGAGRPPQAGYVSDYEATHGSETTRVLSRSSLGRSDAYGRPSTARDDRGRGEARRAGASERRGTASGRRGAPARGRRSSRGMDLDPRLLVGGGALVVVLIVAAIVLAVRGCSASPEPETQTTTLSHLDNLAGSAASDQGADETVNAGAAQDADAAATDGNGDTADGTAGAAGAGEDQAAEENVPTETVITVSVDDGASVWMEITVDDTSVYAAQTEGPFRQEYRPTQSFDIRVDQADAVTVAENGEELSFDRKSAGVSRISVEVPQPAASDGATNAEGASGDAAAADGTAENETTGDEAAQ